ncbi:MAG: CBS domain-containing protein [Longimicrobiales bacterium]
MRARDIMTGNPQYVTTQDSVQRAAQIMRDNDIGMVPAVDDRESCRLRGVLTDRDIAVRCVAENRNGDSRVIDLMSRDLVTARPDDQLEEVMDRMKAEQVRRIPVIDDGDRLLGIIAQADIALEGPGDQATATVVERISEPGRRAR